MSSLSVRTDCPLRTGHTTRAVEGRRTGKCSWSSFAVSSGLCCCDEQGGMEGGGEKGVRRSKMLFATFKHTHTKPKALKTIENKFDPGKHKNTYTNFGSNKLCTNRPSHLPRPPSSRPSSPSSNTPYFSASSIYPMSPCSIFIFSSQL